VPGSRVGEDSLCPHSTRATDLEIHDAVLIAAAFCMYNRYVDGLDTWQPSDPQAYRERAHLLVEQGYVSSVPAAG
jgi:hypothetical protein